ncbi:MAG: bifunctional helix-turn-helix transcriptional regulator/GNAT family N-acetyltransferase [Proteobacteria bacterium]|nr:bifunctional helix-turn-helix transcriptional regulator/GNAT family N-acetyltransferase [Pseudomonadota bacterium]MBU1585854.1 bifunctional helix-turn-helix transcriptional regulator/GNAT family N-acetyltransferase [Pseudomonadota bacterium]MBU2629672.1 bifunctional helix-turn-helix transcriptional regulator/GNAT family N-acetyltransferase [Pseudomonadota bacterium]
MVIELSYVERIRRFNRFYTQILGLLNNKLLKSDYSLAEARVLFELGQTPNIVSKELSKQLHLDPAYLSRILMRFEKQGLIHKKRSIEDTRKQVLSLTSKGDSAIAKLQEMSNLQITLSLSNTKHEEHEQLVKAMEKIEQIFTGEKPQSKTFTLRSHRPGDIGYITYRHAVFYSNNYGFDTTFDAYVASGLAQFAVNYDAQKEHLWVAEDGATSVGSIAIVKSEETIAQLRWFLVEPQAGGIGLGNKLLHEAVEFCKRMNYQKIILWTLSNLYTARHLYEKFGFQVATTKNHEIWGQELTEELWEIKL